jgi:hypothetical protein
MTSDLMLRQKWTLRAHGKQIVLVKHANERSAHVLMKAFIWALYLPDYPDLLVEVRIGDRYKPDVVSFDRMVNEPLRENVKPRFWGESGRVGKQKIHSLAKRFKGTHFALAKWDTRLDPYIEIVTETIDGLGRTAPFDLIHFPADSAERFIDQGGNIHLTHDDVLWIRL